MGFYLVTHSCGHNQYRNIRDRPSDYRDKRLRIEAARTCSACWRAQQDELWAADARKLRLRNQALGLPPLVGTPRQVVWAEIIRSKMPAELAQVVGSLKNGRYLRQRPVVLLGTDAIGRIIEECVAEYITNSSAKFLITVHKSLESHFKKHLHRRLRLEAMKLSVDSKERT